MVLDSLRLKVQQICVARRLADRPVSVTARALTPEQAIGNPEHEDYPILKGRERMVEADFLGAKGHAFTDRPGNFAATLDEILNLPIENNFRRAVFVSTANAVTRHLGLSERTVHCRDADPVACAAQLPEFVAGRYPGARRIFLVGLQPRLLEALAGSFEVRVTDMDADNIGRRKAGILVEPAEGSADCLSWCDLALVSGSTVANRTADVFLSSGRPVCLYGVTCAAVAALLDAPRFCPLGR